MAIKGGYSTVTISNDESFIMKEQPVYDDSGHIMYSTICDLLFSRAAEQVIGCPLLQRVHLDADHLRLRMPYYGDNIHNWVTYTSKEERHSSALHIVLAITQACISLQEIGIQHTDIKPGNVLVSETDARKATLIDFNICSVRTTNEDRDEWSEGIGTWAFTAPEIALYAAPHTNSSVWSIGCLLAFIMYKHPLAELIKALKIDIEDHSAWKMLIRRCWKMSPNACPLSDRLRSFVPEDMQTLLEECLRWNPKERISLLDLYSRLCLLVYGCHKPLYNIKEPVFTPKPDYRVYDIIRIKQLCEKQKKLYLATRAIGIYDLAPKRGFEVPYVALLIAYALESNNLHDDDPFIQTILTHSGISLTSLNTSIIDLCTHTSGRLYFLPADVIIQKQQAITVEHYKKIIQALVQTEDPYTMGAIAERVLKEMHSSNDSPCKA